MISMRLLASSAFLAVVSFTTIAAASDVNQRTEDITMLQAWLSHKNVGLDLGPSTQPEYPLDPAQCEKMKEIRGQSPNVGGYAVVEVNCAEELSEIASRGFSKRSPLITESTFSYELRDDGTRHDLTGLCEIVEFRSVIRDGALHAKSFRGIGFYYASSLSSPSVWKFVTKEELHDVGNVVLKDGSPATVHRFLAQGMCFGQGGDENTLQHRRYVFRPFAQFQDHDHKINNWDSVSSDYVLGFTPDHGAVPSFDRQDDLLRK